MLNTNLINFDDYLDDYEDLLENKEDYFAFVRSLTEKNYNLFFDSINPKKLKRGFKNNHIDHKFSVSEGFKQKINPFHIAHPCNLQMLKARDNKKKNSKCDHSYEELLEKIQTFQRDI
jgi:hypothetical protein